MSESVHMDAASAEKSWAVLQSLICLLREKNILTRSDIEDLRDKVQSRLAARAADPLPCDEQGLVAAASEMAQLSDYIGRRYGGKHRRAM